jgi:hypothetical protein
VLHRQEFLNLSESALVKEVAFVVVESMLAWLSALEDDDRTIFLETMNDEESALCYRLLRDYYLPRPSARREKSVRDAMVLLNQAKAYAFASGKFNML